MNTGVRMERIPEASPRLKARMAGFFELLEALTSGFGQVLVPGMLVVSGDAAATAANVLAHQIVISLEREPRASSMIRLLCDSISGMYADFHRPSICSIAALNQYPTPSSSRSSPSSSF